MKQRTRIAPISAKRLAAEPDLRLRNSTLSRSPLQQTPRTRKPIPKVNVKAKARRDARYKSYLSSSAWKKLRLAVFERDGFQCQAIRECEGEDREFYGEWRQCFNRDLTEKGVGLVCDHLTYARFGRENLEDLRTLCTACNRRLTVSERANWAQPGKRT